MIELLLRAAVSYAASQPELTDTTPPAARRRPKPKRDWREAVTASLYGLAILAGIFIFPRLAAAAYLLRGHPRRARDRRRGPAEPARADPALTHRRCG